MTIVYTARAKATGGRDGRIETDDKKISTQLSRPGSDGAGTNPEQLFACGYAACFGGAVKFLAGQKKIEVGDVTVSADVSLHKGDDGFSLSAVLDVSIAGIDAAGGAELVRAAHDFCPYSKATRGNINVTLKYEGAEI